MKRRQLASVIAFVSCILLLWLVLVGVPPAGPMEAVKSPTPPDVLNAARAVAAYVGDQAGGRAWLLYVNSWSGGVSESDAPLPAGSVYADFRGVVLDKSWPFVRHFNGYVSKNAGYGLRVQYQLEGTSLTPRPAGTLTTSERTLVVDRALAYLRAVDISGAYDDVTTATLMAQNDPDGLLVVKGELPPEQGGASPGEVEIGFTPDLKPDSGTLDSVSER